MDKISDFIFTPVFQERAEENSDVLRGLQNFIEFQKENIDTQDEQLSKLQKMVSHLFKENGCLELLIRYLIKFPVYFLPPE